MKLLRQGDFERFTSEPREAMLTLAELCQEVVIYEEEPATHWWLFELKPGRLLGYFGTEKSYKEWRDG